MLHNLGRLTRRPEFSAFVGTVIVFLFFAYLGWPTFPTFAVSALWLNYAAPIGIIAMPLALVMISGKLDLSVGSTLALGAMTYAIVSGFYGLPDWLGVIAALVAGLAAGWINGLLVTKTKLDSFIVTLGTLFALRGLIFGITRLTTQTVLVPVDVDPSVKSILGGRVTVLGANIDFAFLYFLAVTALVSWIVYRTKWGNWITAIGGDETSARAAGVPVERTTVGLYMGSAVAASLVGVIQVALYGSAQVSAGQSYVFFTIIAVVVGGVLLTGGYGSPVGVFFGTLTFAIVSQGIYSTSIDSDWSSLVLGVLLLIAVLTNNSFRKAALSGGRPNKHTKAETDQSQNGSDAGSGKQKEKTNG